MATQDTTEDNSKETLDDEELETTATQEEDDTSSENEDEDESEETEDSDDDDETEDSDEEETEDEDESEFEKRFTQFKGETYEEYTPNLEKAYGELLGKVTRLEQSAKNDAQNMDAIRSAIKNDPDFAKKLDDMLDGKSQDVTADSATLYARQQLESQMEKEYNEFVESHPELESDPTIQEKVLKTLGDFGNQSKKEGKIMSMGDALRKAWAYHGYSDTKEKVLAKAKESASKSKNGNKAKKTTTTSTKAKHSPEQLAYAKKWGVELE